MECLESIVVQDQLLLGSKVECHECRLNVKQNINNCLGHQLLCTKIDRFIQFAIAFGHGVDDMIVKFAAQT